MPVLPAASPPRTGYLSSDRLHDDQQADRRDHGHRHLPPGRQRGGSGPGRRPDANEHALSESVNVARLAQEMTSR